MRQDHNQADLVDNITEFAMHQLSRRGFVKWLGKAGLALAAGATASVELLHGTAFAQVPCNSYLPGCQGQCVCWQSCCYDPDNGLDFCCSGFCSPCSSLFYYVSVSWYWNGSKCVQTKSCIAC